jgi:hypothetical protein
LDIERYRQQTEEERHTVRILCRLATQTYQASLQLCEQALVAQETAQEMRRLFQRVRDRRAAETRTPRRLPSGCSLNAFGLKSTH